MPTKVGLTLLAALLISAAAAAQDISTEIYYSQDELDIAYELGDLDSLTYIALSEIIERGITGHNAYLLALIPVAGHARTDSVGAESHLASEQLAPFVTSMETRHKALFRHRWRRRQYHGEPSTYTTSLGYDLTPTLRLDFGLRRYQSGRECFTGRSLRYHNPESRLRAVHVGDFTYRLGLGTILGYRGSVLSHSDKSRSQTLLFPVTGRLNGAAMEVGAGSAAITALYSQARNPEHRLETLAGQVRAAWQHYTVSVISARNRLRNRLDDTAVLDDKVALFGEYRQGRRRFALELAWQGDQGMKPAAAVVEGYLRSDRYRLKLLAWSYRDTFRDLASGSVSAAGSRPDTLRDVDLILRSRRTGQAGLRFETVGDLTTRNRLSISALFAETMRYHRDAQLLAALVHRASKALRFRLDHLARLRYRDTDLQRHGTASHRTRLESRVKTGNVVLRNYIGYAVDWQRQSSLSVFFSVRVTTDAWGQLTLWSNIGRLSPNLSRLDRWYGFGEATQHVSGCTDVTMKLGHSYDRDRSRPHQTVVAVELKVRL